MDLKARLIEILNGSPDSLPVLKAVATLELSECYVAGGFIRNAVWDAIYNKQTPAPVNDIDVVYFKPLSAYGVAESELLEKIRENEMNPVWEEEENARKDLEKAVPGFVYEVKNQARMHLSLAKTHKHPPYTSLEEALSDWVETSTPIGVQYEPNGSLKIFAPQGLDDLFSGILRATHEYYEERLRERAKAKGWLARWPELRFEPCTK